MANLVYGSTLKHDITMRRRATYQATYTVYTTSAYTTAYDLTNCSVFAELRKKDGGVIYLDLLPEISATPSTGVITFDIYIPASVKSGEYEWDMLLVTSDEIYTYLVEGNVTVDPSITDGEETYVPGDTGVNIAQRIASAYTRGLTMIPKGNNAITSTVTLENKLGMVIQGHGHSMAVGPGAAAEGSRSNIYWNTTDTTSAMIKVRGAETTWRDLTLTGNTTNFSLAGRPTALFWISREADSGTGSGRHTFQNMVLEYGTAGVQFGSSGTEGNCDMCMFRHVNLRLLDKGFYSKNEMSLNHVVEHSVWSNFSDTTSSVFYYEGGGDLTVTSLAVLSKCTVLTLDQVYTGANIAIQPNNGFFRIRDTKIDVNAIGTCLLNVTGAGASNVPAYVYYDGLMYSGNGAAFDGDAFVTLRGGVKVTFINSVIGPDIREKVKWFTSGHSGTTTLTFINCAFTWITTLPEILDINTSTGNLRLVGINNLGGSGGTTLVPDYAATVGGIG